MQSVLATASPPQQRLLRFITIGMLKLTRLELRSQEPTTEPTGRLVGPSYESPRR